jgi:hypothetical protein
MPGPSKSISRSFTSLLPYRRKKTFSGGLRSATKGAKLGQNPIKRTPIYWQLLDRFRKSATSSGTSEMRHFRTRARRGRGDPEPVPIVHCETFCQLSR